jgi:hypothetical protein
MKKDWKEQNYINVFIRNNLVGIDDEERDSVFEVSIPKGITEIGEDAFKECSSLENAYIHPNTIVDKEAFDVHTLIKKAGKHKNKGNKPTEKKKKKILLYIILAILGYYVLIRVLRDVLNLIMIG